MNLHPDMKREDYTKAVLGSIDMEYQVICEDCGEKSKIAQAIVDHQVNTVKMVFDKYLKGKYQNFLYSESVDG